MKSPFPSIRQKLFTEGKLVRYLGYAIGEVVLIIVGILFALKINDWNEDRKAQVAELALLGAMKLALENDRQILESSVAGLENAEAANYSLQQHIADGQPYNSDLDALFGSVYATGDIAILNVAPYEAFKAGGLELVKNESLRLRITQVYENTYGTIRKHNEFNEGVVFDVLRPYYLAHFRDLSFGQRATPLNYESIKADPVFQNILDYRADFIRRAVIKPYKQAIEQISSLLDDLDDELADR